MYTVFLILHIAAAVLFLGPVMVSVSVFGKYAVEAAKGDQRADGVATTMHGISKLYGYLSSLVPIMGVILLIMDWQTHKTNPLLHTSVLLSAIAWGLLLGLIIPKQKKVLAGLSSINDTTTSSTTVVDYPKAKSQLAMLGGIFNLLWVITFVLMFL